MVNPGAVVIVVYFLLQLLIYGVGVLHLDGSVVEATKTRMAIGLFANAGVALYVLHTVQTVRQRSIVLGMLSIGLTFECVVGLLQSFTGIDLRFLFQPPGFVLNLEETGFTERNGAFRVVGTSHHAIEFAVLAAVAVPLTLHLARYATKPLYRQCAAVGCLIAVFAMPAGGSRAGVVALAAALLTYMFAFTLRQIANGILVGIGAGLVYVVAAPASAYALWLTVVKANEDGSVLSRLADYSTVARTFHDHPWFGLGLGGNPPTVYGFLDNEWLQSIVQGGIVGFAAMLVVVGGTVAGLTAGLRTARSSRERDQAYAIGAALVGIIASSFTFDLFTYQQATFVYFVLFGLMWSSWRRDAGRR
ncbi:O-antigen ligase family protein [Rhodococcus olei]|uniref:O-antigen ligase family protein n=1 Tax=Rhodococcus olei TaxID=2161675 RepID=A0ABP8NSR9_9NOCA